MEHSVKEIGKRYSRLSEMRNDKKLFGYDKFIEFARNNMKKYQLSENEYNEGDLVVTTFHTDDLIKDFKQTL